MSTTVNPMNFITDWQNFLAFHNITNQDVLILIALSAIALFFSIREVLSWYLKTSSINSELRKTQNEILILKNEIRELQSLVKDQHNSMAQLIFSQGSEVNKAEASPDSHKSSTPLFPLQ